MFQNCKTQILELRENKTFLICAFLCVIYLISGYWKWIEIAVSICAVVFLAILPLQSSFCVFMFLHSFTLSNIGFDSCFMVTLIGYCIILLVKYYQGVKKGKYNFNKKLVCLLASFLSFSIFISCFSGLYRGAWLYLTYVPFFYLIFNMKEEFNIAQGMNFLLGGLLTTSLLAIVTLIFPGFQYEVFMEGRFRAFTNHPNYTYMRALFVVCYYMYRYLNKDLTLFKFGAIYAFCGVITLTTLSKTGIGMLVLMTLIFVVFFLKQDFKKNIKIVGIFGFALLILSLVCYKFIGIIISRFLGDFQSGNFWNSLLTGRDDIWKDYLTAIFEGPIKFLCGHGILAEEVFIHAQGQTRASHNLYIFMLYRFGLIGCILIGWLVWKLLKSSKLKAQIIAWLPMIFLLIESLFDNTFEWNHFTYFAFAVMILFLGNKKKDSKDIKKENESYNLK